MSRLQQLFILRDRVAEAILAEMDAERGRRRRVKRVRSEEPPCGTEKGYQWHRYRKQIPLPESDPCGCAHAHRMHNRKQYALTCKGDAA